MDCRRCGLFGLYVLLLTLLVQSRSMPTPESNCTDLKNRAQDIARLLFKEAGDLRRNYTEFHKSENNPIPGQMPDSTVSTANITEMLQDMVLKNMHFILHISKTEHNQKESWNGLKSVEDPLKTVNHRLGYLTSILKEILRDLNIPVPSAPPPLKFTHTYESTKMEYGRGVIEALNTWLTHVQQALQQTDVCSLKNEPVM